MTTEIRVPTLGESVTEAIVGKWYKKPGDAVKADEPLVELETDKVTLEVNAPAAGVISEIVVKEGETVAVGAVLGSIGEGSGAAAAKPAAAPAPEKVSQAAPNGRQQPAAEQGSPAPAVKSAPTAAVAAETLSPAVLKAVSENSLDPASIPGTGKDGRILKGDVLAVLDRGAQAPA
ncbi:biotin/lipoyl-containing protein, partial [Rhodomicrobium vannielii]